MTELKFTTPTVGEKITVAEPLVDTALNEIKSFINGNKLDGTTNIKAEGVKESNLEKAVQEKLSGTIFGLATSSLAVSAEGVNGKLYLMQKTGTTLTLPAATNNRVIGIYFAAGEGTGACKVTASAGKIYGGFITGSTTVELTDNQGIIVEAEGTNWRIVAGEPKRTQEYGAETSYTQAEAEAGVEPSATRMAYVIFKETPSALTVGGKSVSGGPLLVPPGQKWKGTSTAKTFTLLL